MADAMVGVAKNVLEGADSAVSTILQRAKVLEESRRETVSLYRLLRMEVNMNRLLLRDFQMRKKEYQAARKGKSLAELYLESLEFETLEKVCAGQSAASQVVRNLVERESPKIALMETIHGKVLLLRQIVAVEKKIRLKPSDNDREKRGGEAGVEDGENDDKTYASLFEDSRAGPGAKVLQLITGVTQHFKELYEDLEAVESDMEGCCAPATCFLACGVSGYVGKAPKTAEKIDIKLHKQAHDLVERAREVAAQRMTVQRLQEELGNDAGETTTPLLGDTKEDTKEDTEEETKKAKRKTRNKKAEAKKALEALEAEYRSATDALVDIDDDPKLQAGDRTNVAETKTNGTAESSGACCFC